MYLASVRNDEEIRLQPQLRVLLFGEAITTYSNEGSVVDVPIPSRCMLLMAYLILHPKTRLRERIAAALWPDVMDGEARTNLRRILHELVRSLPASTEPWIVIDAQRIYWNPRAPLWCDVEAFDRLVTSECTRANAIELYGGDLLAGTDDEWAVTMRGIFRDRQLEALGALADTCAARGDLSGAANAYRALLGLDPYREDAMRALIEVRFARGDRARAVSEYRAFSHKLKSELGVDPMPETLACYERILRYKAVVRDAGSSIAPNEQAARSSRHSRRHVRNFIGATAT